MAELIVETTIDARWRVFAIRYLLDEIERVLRDKLGFHPRLASLARQRARRRCEPASAPPSRHGVPADAYDSPILRAALNAGADYLITDDRHLLQLNPYEGLRILSMRDYAQLLRAQGLLRS